MEHPSCDHSHNNASSSTSHTHESINTQEEHIPLAAQTKIRDDADENSHLEEVCDSFRQYATFARCDRVGRAHRFHSSMTQSDLKFLPPAAIPGTPEAHQREKEMQKAEIRNQFFFDSMLRHAGMPNSQDVRQGDEHLFSNNSHENESEQDEKTKKKKWSSDENISKVSSVLKSLARDWSEDGAMERNQSYQPILDGVEKYLASKRDESGSRPPRIVVPGAGVGRLALELSSRGYEVQGNEFSFHMLVASDFILNGGCSPQHQFAISPWLTETRNVCRNNDRARSILIPDVDPVELIFGGNNNDQLEGNNSQDQYPPPEFSMAAGEFLSIYSNPKERGKWDAVVSCFFLDTAPCVVHYIKTMYDMLRDDGIMINFGPLLYHWSGPSVRPEDTSMNDYKNRNSNFDERYLSSVDMSWEDVREIMIRVGFVLEEERLGIPARYTSDCTSMMATEYNCVYCVARKKR